MLRTICWDDWLHSSWLSMYQRWHCKLCTIHNFRIAMSLQTRNREWDNFALMESLAPEWEYSWQPQPGSRKNWDYLWVQRSWSNWFFKILRQLDSALLFVSPLCVFSRQTRHFVARCKGIQTAGTSFLSWGRIKSQRSKHFTWSANACSDLLHAHEELQKRIQRKHGHRRNGNPRGGVLSSRSQKTDSMYWTYGDAWWCFSLPTKSVWRCLCGCLSHLACVQSSSQSCATSPSGSQIFQRLKAAPSIQSYHKLRRPHQDLRWNGSRTHIWEQAHMKPRPRCSLCVLWLFVSHILVSCCFRLFPPFSRSVNQWESTDCTCNIINIMEVVTSKSRSVNLLDPWASLDWLSVFSIPHWTRRILRFSNHQGNHLLQPHAMRIALFTLAKQALHGWKVGRWVRLSERLGQIGQATQSKKRKVSVQCPNASCQELEAKSWSSQASSWLHNIFDWFKSLAVSVWDSSVFSSRIGGSWKSSPSKWNGWLSQYKNNNAKKW